ncbi:helix-turn-helix domain-containing protein [Prevotella koreensis]|uniref:helix-turn-helix domain-containing protein n=1 Tax=Prevotella koreensis TaxID=2490854 RepID=UPI003F9EE8D4
MNQIKDVLERKGIKQEWLTELLCKSYNMISSYVQNRRRLSLVNLYRIAKIFDIDVKRIVN